MDFHFSSRQHFKDFLGCFCHSSLPLQLLRSEAERGDPLLAERWRFSPQPGTGRGKGWGGGKLRTRGGLPQGTKVSPLLIPVELLQVLKQLSKITELTFGEWA